MSTPLSHVSPANAVVDWEPLRQTCAVSGSPRAVVPMSATATLAYLCTAAFKRSFLGHARELKQAYEHLHRPMLARLSGMQAYLQGCTV